MSAQDFPADRLDQALEPPDEPERSIPLTAAPFSALLRAADDWLTGVWQGPMAHLVACEAGRLRNALVASLHRVGCKDVELTEEEWQEAFPPHNPFDARL